MEAVSAGHVGVEAVLVNKGASINYHNDVGESTLTLACYKSIWRRIKMFNAH